MATLKYYKIIPHTIGTLLDPITEKSISVRDANAYTNYDPIWNSYLLHTTHSSNMLELRSWAYAEPSFRDGVALHFLMCESHLLLEIRASPKCNARISLHVLEITHTITLSQFQCFIVSMLQGLKLSQLIWPSVRGRRNKMISLESTPMLNIYPTRGFFFLLASALTQNISYSKIYIYYYIKLPIKYSNIIHFITLLI